MWSWGPLILVEGNINAAKYKQMLEDYLLSYLQELGLESYMTMPLAT